MGTRFYWTGGKQMKLQVIVDMDGTLSDSTHRQHFMQTKKKNWMAFYEGMVDDPPNHDIVWLVESLRQRGATILFCSGRPSEYRFQTEEWLIKHDVSYERLYMRKTEDYRPDDIIKLELLEEMRVDGYEPNMAID